MKKSKMLLFIIMIILTQTNVIKASTLDNYEKTMIELGRSIKTSDYKKLDYLLKEDAFQKISVGKVVTTNTKRQLVNELRSQGAQLNCEIAVNYLSTSNSIVVARMDLIFKEFTVYNYVTLEKNNLGEWKIASIHKMYNLIEDTKKSIVNNIN